MSFDSASNPAIIFNQVTKIFSRQTHKTFKEFLPALIYGEKTKDSFIALNNISFNIMPGETVGLIGPNGSGKSTILKLIAGVMTPAHGTIKVHGKVAPLIELGAGMHPELSGRENIYLNGAILGLRRKDIDRYFQEIVDFSELSEFIDQPIKHYSSGMYMRLAFSIAINVKPAILLIDEILAVGDAAFQQKCFTKMEEFKQKKVTILFVSHDLDTVKKFCQRAIYINHANLIFQGNSVEACDLYHHEASSL